MSQDKSLHVVDDTNEVKGIKLDSNLKSIFIYFAVTNISLFSIILVENIYYNSTYIWNLIMVVLHPAIRRIFKSISSFKIFR